MSTVGQREIKTQQRVIAFLLDALGYAYLGHWKDREDNSNIEETYLRTFLRWQGYSDSLIDKALFELHRVAGDQTKSLLTISTRRSMACCATASRSGPTPGRTSRRSG